MPVRKLAFARYALIPLVLLIVAVAFLPCGMFLRLFGNRLKRSRRRPPTPTPQKLQESGLA
jgi:hypothetical protein